MHIFCNLLKLWAFFSVTNTTAINELSLPVMVFISLELHCFGSVRRSHILHLAYCCIRRLMNMFLLFSISVSGIDLEKVCFFSCLSAALVRRAAKVTLLNVKKITEYVIMAHNFRLYLLISTK